MSESIEDLIADFEEKFDISFDAPLPKEPSKTSEIKVSEEALNPEIDVEEIKATLIEDLKNAEVIEKDEQKEQKPDENSSHEVEPETQKSEHVVQDKVQTEQDKYRHLSQKLEKALKKISTSKRIIHSQTQSSDLYTRFEQYERRKQKQLAIKRSIEEEKKFHGLRDRPKINKKSKKLAQQIQLKPIYERFQKIVEEKKKKQEENEELKRLREEKEYEQFIQQFQTHTKIPEHVRDIETFYDDMSNWKEKVAAQIKKKQEAKDMKDMEGYTFKPEINKKSEKMENSKKRIPVHERQIVEKNQLDEPELTFKPNLRKPKII